jgi:predicted nucleotide-binding protein
MEKTKKYQNVRFNSDTLRAAREVFEKVAPEGTNIIATIRNVEQGDESWKFDSDQEFFASYRKPCTKAHFVKVTQKENVNLAAINLYFSTLGGIRFTNVTVQNITAPNIEEVFEVFEKNLEASRLPVPVKPRPTPVKPSIFIGHGRSPLWRDLKDHLTDKQGYSVTAYEVGARAGHTIRDILSELLVGSSFALLVLTGEDETSEGELRARQNVIHELGLFQGKLGFPRAIAVVERGVEMLSNLDGVQQLRFNSGNIAEVYGDVIATLRREFGDAR